MNDQKKQASEWFETLRNRICATFETIETELTGTAFHNAEPGRFEQKTWRRATPDGSEGGGGEMSVLKGRVFEKVGVNISTVHGSFTDDFAEKIPGAKDNAGQFWAAGISVVAHMRSPHVPPVHMNTRMIVTSKSWFGGGADLNPIIEDKKDSAEFHAALRQCCDRHNPAYYQKYKDWADEYFFIRHRNESRGIGGIFYDYLDSGDWNADFAFTRDVGETFLDIYPRLVRRHMHKEWNAKEREHQLIRRGRYVEFNLVYDRGTVFGLQTGGNVEAILMSLPPEAKWD